MPPVPLTIPRCTPRGNVSPPVQRVADQLAEMSPGEPRRYNPARADNFRFSLSTLRRDRRARPAGEGGPDAQAARALARGGGRVRFERGAALPGAVARRPLRCVRSR